MRLIPLLIAIVPAVLMSACVSPRSPRGLNELPLTVVARLDRHAAFSASPDGRLVAYGDSALLLDDGSGRPISLSKASPVALGWRRDGERFAAGFTADNGQDRLAVFDRSGRLLDEHLLPGRVLAVTWSSRNDLLVAGYRLREFSFGANLTQWLWRIDGRAVEEIRLGDATIEPATVGLVRETLPQLLSPSFSPAGDELVFARLHDPPQFPPYLQLHYRNWQVPTARRLPDLPVQPVVFAWGEGGQAILCQSGNEPPRQFELWPAAIGQAQEGKPSRHWRSGLWNGYPLQVFADGSYLIAMHGRLYAGSGLPVSASVEHDDRLWSMRKWRFEGLITPDEFEKAAGEAVRP